MPEAGGVAGVSHHGDGLAGHDVLADSWGMYLPSSGRAYPKLLVRSSLAARSAITRSRQTTTSTYQLAWLELHSRTARVGRGACGDPAVQRALDKAGVLAKSGGRERLIGRSG
jgi:hypothetical protein